MLLEGGRTAHSTFYTPTDEIQLHEPPRIPYDSEEAKKIREAKAIVVDEITMLNADAFDHIDQTVRSVMPAGKRGLSFGGKVVLISGDWKQLLPVVEGAANERLESVASCVKQSSVFHEFVTLRLTQNMRVDANQARWREIIYGIGTGRNYLTLNGRPTLLTEIPDEVCVDNMEELMEFCFPQAALADPLKSLSFYPHPTWMVLKSRESFRLRALLRERHPHPHQQVAVRYQRADPREDRAHRSGYKEAHRRDCVPLDRHTHRGERSSPRATRPRCR